MAKVMDSRGFREGDGLPAALVAAGSGLVSGEEVCGEMAYGERSCEQCDRGRKAASVGNAGLLEDPGCPQPEQQDDRRRCGDTTGVATCQKAEGEVASPCRPKASRVFW